MADGRGVAARLAARLDARGVDVVVVADPEELDGSRGVVFLPGLDPVTDGEQARDVLRDAFRAARAAARDVAWMTVTALGGDMGLSGAPEPCEALLAGLAGLTRTVAREHPAGFARALDLLDSADPDVLASHIEAEVGQAGPVDVLVGPDGRGTLALDPAPLAGDAGVAAASLPFGRDEVVVVSGGARGVTAACVVALAARTGAHFVLLGRSAVDAEEPAELAGVEDEAALKRFLHARDPAVTPAELGRRVASIRASREVRGTLAAIRRAGASGRYVPVDVADAEAVAAVVAALRAEGRPIAGLVHAAGVLHDKRVADKTLAQFDAVVDTKLRGAAALLAATRTDPLRALVFFSSVAARAGNPGQADYALANEALNRLAASEARRRPGCVVRSIGWGPWEGGMVTAALARAFQARGVALVPLAEGAAAFVAELAADAAPVECVIGGELAPATERTRALRVRARTHPLLADHALGGAVVVPAMFVAQALRAVAGALDPARAPDVLAELRVLRGVSVPAFDDAGVLFAVSAERAGEALVVRATGPDGRPAYQACAEAGGPTRMPVAGTLEGLRSWDGDVYADGTLFHGPAFRVLADVRVGDAGMEARLMDPVPLGWTRPEDVEVALLDGAMQLAALWTRTRLGGASLPTSVARLAWGAAPVSGTLRATLRPVRATRASTVCDIVLLDAEDTVAVELLGVETHVLASGAYPVAPGAGPQAGPATPLATAADAVAEA